MKERVTRAGIFFRTLGKCLSQTWQEADKHYHIPKSRFRDDRSSEQGHEFSPAGLDEGRKKHYLRNFRNCFTFAWGASDRHYHIPKSRHGKAV